MTALSGEHLRNWFSQLGYHLKKFDVTALTRLDHDPNQKFLVRHAFSIPTNGQKVVTEHVIRIEITREPDREVCGGCGIVIGSGHKQFCRYDEGEEKESRQ